MTAKSETVQYSSKVHELISALPEEANVKDKLHDCLSEHIARISSKTAPVGSFPRMWILSSMQAKITMGYLAYAVKSRFVNDSERQRLLNESNLAAAVKLVGTMGYLRGAVMKVGQMLANLPKIMPQEFSDVLGSLHSEAPPMHFSMVRELFLDELGSEPAELFSSFEPEAFAAASMGQVHRARLKTGEEVAVKIQYPNMMQMIKSDIRNLRTLLLPMRFLKEWDYIIDHIKDAEEMLKLEANYEREAEFMQVAYDLFQDDDRIVIPKSYNEFSSSRVLTMDYLPGKHLQQFLNSDPSGDLRNHFGELISVALMRLSYVSRKYYADPHPGNFLMYEDGRLGVIDFGCYRQLTDEEWQISNNGEKAVMFTNDEKSLHEAVAYGCLYNDVSEMDHDRVEFVKRCIRWQAEPAMKDEPFDFADDHWFQRGVDINLEIVRRQQSRYGPVYNWINRTLLGHRTLMFQLKCKFNFRKVFVENNPNLSGLE